MRRSEFIRESIASDKTLLMSTQGYSKTASYIASCFVEQNLTHWCKDKLPRENPTQESGSFLNLHGIEEARVKVRLGGRTLTHFISSHLHNVPPTMLRTHLIISNTTPHTRC